MPYRKKSNWRRKLKDARAAADTLGVSHAGATWSGRYHLTCKVQEDHAQNLYSVQFNDVTAGCENVFATVGANRATIYRAEPNGDVKLVQAYVDASEDEAFFACAWCKASGVSDALLAIAGVSGIVRVINVTTEGVWKDIRGHGNSVNDVCAHPLAPHLLISASKDESVRLWNINAGVCVAVFAGAWGHRNEVLTLHFKTTDADPMNGDIVFASGAMDNVIKVWSIAGYEDVVQKAETWTDGVAAFPTARIQTPCFSSFRVHKNYVDCVRWFGDLIMSKSVEQSVTLWHPEIPKPGPGETRPVKPGESFRKVADYAVKNADIWFVRFSINAAADTLLCGNRTGDLFAWKLRASPPSAGAIGQLSHKACKTCVRQTALSVDGSIALAACDGGGLFRWDFVEHGAGSAPLEAGQKKRKKEESEDGDGDVVVVDVTK